MLIELHGGQFRNKGALKMLHVAMSGIRAQVSDCRFAADTVYADAETMRANGIQQIWPQRGWMSARSFRWRLLLQNLSAAMPRALARRSTVSARDSTVSARDIDAWIDLAGFAYSDQWGVAPCVNISALVRHLRQRRIPIVFLPQALGPFQRKENVKAFREILEAADLVYARDSQSFEYSNRLNANSGSLRLAPDITLFQGARFEPAMPSERPHAYIVPNVQVLKHKEVAWHDQYISMLCRAAEVLNGHHIEPRILVHDSSGEDLLLAQEIRKQATVMLPIVEEANPWEIKNLIGEAMLIVGSRFHALVAAFSKGVPAIALGWSHKYEALFEDFGMERLVIKPKVPGALEEAVQELCAPESNMRARAVICERLTSLLDVNRKMWLEIGSVLNGGS